MKKEDINITKTISEIEPKLKNPIYFLLRYRPGCLYAIEEGSSIIFYYYLGEWIPTINSEQFFKDNAFIELK